ncbi:MAG: hypothetical protein RTV41_13895 [Candidatus Thorarchaeota archaeon]
MFDHKITGENDVTANLFTNEYRNYALNIVKTTQETTGISMDVLLEELR